MPDPGYADGPPGFLLLVIGLFVLFIVALVLQSCM